MALPPAETTAHLSEDIHDLQTVFFAIGATSSFLLVECRTGCLFSRGNTYIQKNTLVHFVHSPLLSKHLFSKYTIYSLIFQ